MAVRSSRWTRFLICVLAIVGMSIASGCKLPSQQYGGGGAPAYPQYSASPGMPGSGTATQQPSVPGFQGYPAVSRSGGIPQRGIDGAPAFGAGPGGSGMMPR